MQDRFKFRVVYYNDVEKKYFIFEPDLISADGTARAYAYGESGADEYYDTVTLNQCTGLKDKNGTLIYEGDIVKDLTYSYDVRYLCVFAPIFGGLGLISIQNWKDYNFCRENWEDYYNNSEVRRLDNRFKLADQGNKLKCFSMRELKMNDFEVIGNIYENPELLKEETNES